MKNLSLMLFTSSDWPESSIFCKLMSIVTVLKTKNLLYSASKKPFIFVFCFFCLSRAALGEKQVLDDEYGFSGLFTTLFLFLSG